MDSNVYGAELNRILSDIQNVEYHKQEMGNFSCCYFGEDIQWKQQTIDSLVEMGMRVKICTREEYIDETGWIPNDNIIYFYLVDWEIH